MAVWQVLEDAGLQRVLGLVRGLLIILFAAMLGLLAARFFWLIVEPEGSVSKTLPDYSSISKRGAGPSGRADINVLFRDNPFGEVAQASSGMADAPETTLDLKLVGLRAATIDAEGAAIIVTPDHRQHLYAPGDKILDNVYLDRVLTDRVILKKNGNLESLMRDDREGRFLVIDGEEPRQTPIEPAGGRGRQVLDRQSFVENVRLRPVSKDDQIIGYQLSPRSDKEMFDRAGLKDGDIVTVLNGLPIADIAPEELIQQFGAANDLSLKLIRGEESVLILITFETGNRP